MQKKMMLVFSFALATILVVGQIGFAAGSDNHGMGSMMNGNGMSEMMKMMDAMNSPEGQEMMKACDKFMESHGDDEAEEASNTNSQL